MRLPSKSISKAKMVILCTPQRKETQKKLGMMKMLVNTNLNNFKGSQAV
jgi:ribosomal protein L30E